MVDIWSGVKREGWGSPDHVVSSRVSGMFQAEAVDSDCVMAKCWGVLRFPSDLLYEADTQLRKALATAVPNSRQTPNTLTLHLAGCYAYRERRWR